MRPFARTLFCTLFLLLCLRVSAQAAPDTAITANIKPPSPPLDIAASFDGKRTYILCEDGKLYIYSENGTLEESLTVAAGMDSIAVSGMQQANIQERIHLADSKTKTVQILTIDFPVVLDIKGDPFLGPENAPVTIVEFSDFECPFCSAVGGLFAEVLDKYPDQVKIVFKQFPLSFHKQAQPAAMAALAAHQQGKFWQYHDLLFENQKSFSETKFVELAKQAGLDLVRFNEDRKSPAIQQKIRRDIIQARQVGVQGTPTLFINGRRLKERNFETIRKMIDQELARKRSK